MTDHIKEGLNLKTNIDENSGFCFGVTAAINKAEELLGIYSPLYILEEIVHNEVEMNRLKSLGATIISHEDLPNITYSHILFRAHGEPPETYDICRRNNNTVHDASCPIILKLQQKMLRSYKRDERIYIYGKRNHPEIIALQGTIFQTAIVFEDIDELDISQMPSEITLYSQTTMSVQKFYRIIKHLRARGISVYVRDTICREVANRKSKMQNFCKSHDTVVFVAGRHSSNGQFLFNACKDVNSRSHFVTHPDEINRDWFKQEDSVGICGATSTPDWLLKQAREKISSL